MVFAWDVAGAIALLCLIAGSAVPRLIAAVPEPAAEPAAESAAGPESEPKVAYVAIAARPGLALRTSLASGAAGAVVGGAVGWQWALTFLVPMVPWGVALAVIDWHTRLLPTRLIAPGYVAVIGLVVLGWPLSGGTADLQRAGLGWVIAGGLFFVLWLIHPRGMGYGDVRLAGVLGIALGFLGWGQLLLGVYAGFLLGGVIGGLLSVFKIVERRSFPFGPFMLAGALLGVAVGDPLLGGLVPGRG